MRIIAKTLWLICMIPIVSALASNSSPPIPNAVISRKDESCTSYYYFSPKDGNQIANRNKNDERHQTIVSRRRFQINFDHPVLKIKSALRSTFLPVGYPHKTPRGYLSYSMYSWIQDLSTQLRGVIATQRVLEGVGVGREGATALSASLNFILRDGCGMASTLLFTAATASKFREDVKRWRLFADLVNNVGITFEVTATLVPRQLFLPMICAGNMCKAMCGVAAGACNGAINLHWAKGSDISDINAKFGAQHTVTGSLGLVFAATFAKSVSETSQSILWAMYSVLTVLHILANMKCLKLIAFSHLNTTRMNIIVQQFLLEIKKSGYKNKNDAIVNLDTSIEIAAKEPLFFGARSAIRSSSHPIRLGVSFNSIAQSSRKDQISLICLTRQIKLNQYMISVGNKNCKGKGQCILVAFGHGVGNKVKTKAYLHALLLKNMLQQYGNTKACSQIKEERSTEAETTAAAEIEHLWRVFEKSACKAGWNLESTELQLDGYELSLE